MSFTKKQVKYFGQIIGRGSDKINHNNVVAVEN